MEDRFKSLKTYKKGSNPKLRVNWVKVPRIVRTKLVKEVLPETFVNKMEFLGLTDEVFNGNERIPDEKSYKERLVHYLKLFPIFEEFIFESCHWRNVNYNTNFEIENETKNLYTNSFQYLYYAVFGEKIPLELFENWLQKEGNHNRSFSDFIRENKFGKYKQKSKNKKNDISIESFNIVSENAHYGVKNFKGELIVPCKYDELYNLTEGLAKVKLNEKWGCIDKHGNVVIPIIYDLIEDFINGRAKVRIKNDGYYRGYLWGYIDKTGVEIIPIQFRQIDEFIGGIAKAKIDDCWGYIDEKGNEIIPIEYSEIQEFIEGKAKVEVLNEYYMPGYKETRCLYGYINIYGEEIISVIYSSIGRFINGVAIASKRDLVDYYYDENIDENIKIYGDLYGMIDINGEMIVDFKYRIIENFVNGKAIARKFIKNQYEYEKWGAFDEKGNVIIQFVYDSIEEFTNGKAKAQKNGKLGIIDELGNEIIPFQYDLIDEFVKGKAIAKKNGKYGIIDENNNEIILFEYDSIAMFSNGEANARKNGFNGVLTEEGVFNVSLENKYYDEFVTKRAEVSNIDNYTFNVDINIKAEFLSKFNFNKVYYELKYYDYLISISDFKNEFLSKFDYKLAEDQLRFYNHLVNCELDEEFKESIEAVIRNKKK